ncbi:MAG TPA: sodium-dependent transporter [Nitrospirales bacterium]|nr:sodium-dependent transporter [Nitrospirales bacterium]
MTEKRESIHGQWSSRWAFILAATGSAVGLGNIWRFPYITGENGGGAFLFIYVLCVLVVGIPIMMAEVMLGRRGRQAPINTMRTLAREEGQHQWWQCIGWMGILAGFLVLTFYSVVAGWTLAYVVRAATGVFHGTTAAGARAIFTQLIADPERLLAWHTIFMAVTIMVVSRGVSGGLERTVRFLMPALFIILIALVGYAMTTEKFVDGLLYLFTPDFSKITAAGVFIALGQAFFSLSLGMGAIMIYGAYLPQQTSIASTSCIIAFTDTFVAILAGIAIFPIVFTYGLEPSEGTGLIFKTLPIAFGQMPFGQLFGTLFFVLLVFAALTSAISLLEPVVTWLVENHGMSRVMATSSSGIVAWLIGVGCLLSLNLWSGATLWDMTFFDLVEGFTANILLPLGGLLMAVFAAWLMSKQSTVDELAIGDGTAYRAWRGLLRYVAPVFVVLIFLHAVGILDMG